MRRRAILFSATIAAAASLAVAAPARANIPVCAGTQRTIIVCVDPTGQTLYEDCVVVVSPPCIPVAVPGPTIQCGGDVGQYMC